MQRFSYKIRVRRETVWVAFTKILTDLKVEVRGKLL